MYTWGHLKLCVCIPVCSVVNRRRRETRELYSSLPPIRMTELRDVEVDSGIEDRGSDSIRSDSNSVGSGSNSTTSSLLDVNEDTIGMEQRLHQPETETTELNEVDAIPVVSRTRSSSWTIEGKLTVLVQKALLLTVARAVMLPHTVKYSFISNTILRNILRWFTRLVPVILFAIILASMSGAMSRLKPSDHPPQFFDPDSNIQKMLDLSGNLTERSAVNCWQCLAWYNEGGWMVPYTGIGWLCTLYCGTGKMSRLVIGSPDLVVNVPFVRVTMKLEGS